MGVNVKIQQFGNFLVRYLSVIFLRCLLQFDKIKVYMLNTNESLKIIRVFCLGYSIQQSLGFDSISINHAEKRLLHPMFHFFLRPALHELQRLSCHVPFSRLWLSKKKMPVQLLGFDCNLLGQRFGHSDLRTCRSEDELRKFIITFLV